METVTQQELLERTPPTKSVLVSDFEAMDRQGLARIRTPEITLHCGQCSGDRFFAPADQGGFVGKREATDIFLTYICRNCRKSFKTFALGAVFDQQSGSWRVFKYGEAPSFGPQLPPVRSRLLGLIAINS